VPREVGSSNTERSSGAGASGIVLLTLAADQFLMTLVNPAILKNPTLRGGLTSFFFQYLVQGGLFFAVPPFLSVALGLSAIQTGIRLLPLSITLLLAAAGIPKVFPTASPRRVVQVGFLALFAGLVVMVAALQNTLTNLGASGTALGGAVLISALSASFIAGIQNNPAVPGDVKHKAQVQLAGGVPFVSDADLNAALKKAGVSSKTAVAVVAENTTARLDGLRSSLSVMAIIALIALPFTRRSPPISRLRRRRPSRPWPTGR
jgi:hypothetical protein